MGCSGGGYRPGPGAVYGNSGCGSCPDLFGCPYGVCPDWEIKRHDTLPPFVLSVSDCAGPLDLTNSVVEVSMWAKGRLKKNITAAETSFALADNIGFYQVLPGDIIMVNQVRSPELMLITGFDENLKLINVIRGYQGTTPSDYVKGTSLRMFRVLNGMGQIKVVTENVQQLDGSTKTIVVDSELIYPWRSQDTCLPGCYWLEFKLLKMLLLTEESSVPIPSVSPCGLGYGVESVRRFPVACEGFLVKISDSPTSESLVV